MVVEVCNRNDSGCALQVPVLRDALLKQGNWQQIADNQQHTVFSRASSTQQSKSQMDEMLKALDFMCNLQPDYPQARVSLCLFAWMVPCRLSPTAQQSC